MRRFVRSAIALSVAISLVSSHPAAALVPPANGRWYYHIGGAEAVMAPLNRNVTTVALGGSLDLGLGLSCHGFDPTLGLSTALNNIAENLKNLVTNAVTGLISNLPMLILQRANPSLYELVQELIGYANAAVSLGVKSCEQMQAEIARGQNPFDHWLTLSKSYTWKNQAGQTKSGTQTVDVLSALQTVEDTGGDDGVPWVGGNRAGGANQPPIKIVSDVVKAGYNAASGHDLASTISAGSDMRLGQIWKSPQEAIDYAVAVLGDVDVQTKDNASRTATPGHGLGPKIEKDRRDMEQALIALVKGDVPPSPENLMKASAPGTQLSREVLDAIRRLTPEEQSVAIAKLAAEAAAAVNVEKALTVRRLLLTGFQEPNVYASPATDEIKRMVDVIDREIDQLLYETRIRRELFADTAATLLDMGRAMDNRGGAVTRLRAHDPTPVEGGAVKR
jgi:integrating conjugative element protein (TIGR03755 family)